MRPIQWTSITASHDGEGKRLPVGAYVVKITEAIDREDKSYVELIYDIAEGEYKDFYNDKWGQEHPGAHRIFMSYKDKALPMTKGRLECISASNAGFDALAAWNGSRLDMFTGRLFGVNLQEEEYEGKDGETKTRINPKQVVPADKVREGRCKRLGLKRLDGTVDDPDAPRGVVGGGREVSYKPSAAHTEPEVYSDVPF